MKQLTKIEEHLIRDRIDDALLTALAARCGLTREALSEIRHQVVLLVSDEIGAAKTGKRVNAVREEENAYIVAGVLAAARIDAALSALSPAASPISFETPDEVLARLEGEVSWQAFVAGRDINADIDAGLDPAEIRAQAAADAEGGQ